MDSADDELMVRYLEGAATPGEVTALEARLAGDHQARREFVRLAHLQALFIDLPRAPAAALQRRSWRWPLVLLGSAAALVLIGMLWHRQPAGPAGPAITAVSGTVHCLRAGIEVDVRAGDALHAGDRLSVDAASQLSFSWRDRVAIRLAEQSEATVGGPSRAWPSPSPPLKGWRPTSAQNSRCTAMRWEPGCGSIGARCGSRMPPASSASPPGHPRASPPGEHRRRIPREHRPPLAVPQPPSRPPMMAMART
jgi:hypothetical protein